MNLKIFCSHWLTHGLVAITIHVPNFLLKMSGTAIHSVIRSQIVLNFRHFSKRMKATIKKQFGTQSFLMNRVKLVQQNIHMKGLIDIMVWF